MGRTSTASGRMVGEQGAGWGARGGRVAGGAVVALCAVAVGGACGAGRIAQSPATRQARAPS